MPVGPGWVRIASTLDSGCIGINSSDCGAAYLLQETQQAARMQSAADSARQALFGVQRELEVSISLQPLRHVPEYAVLSQCFSQRRLTASCSRIQGFCRASAAAFTASAIAFCTPWLDGSQLLCANSQTPQHSGALYLSPCCSCLSYFATGLASSLAASSTQPCILHLSQHLSCKHLAPGS